MCSITLILMPGHYFKVYTLLGQELINLTVKASQLYYNKGRLATSPAKVLTPFLIILEGLTFKFSLTEATALYLRAYSFVASETRSSPFIGGPMQQQEVPCHYPFGPNACSNNLVGQSALKLIPLTLGFVPFQLVSAERNTCRSQFCTY
jgi:hypothetical protein